MAVSSFCETPQVFNGSLTSIGSRSRSIYDSSKFTYARHDEDDDDALDDDNDDDDALDDALDDDDDDDDALDDDDDALDDDDDDDFTDKEMHYSKELAYRDEATELYWLEQPFLKFLPCQTRWLKSVTHSSSSSSSSSKASSSSLKGLSTQYDHYHQIKKYPLLKKSLQQITKSNCIPIINYN
ncbi:unnamed protein product [Schistosoma margrebowiei]|uniref:Uncharacterized protein n=1 Tax=Schistosoma margrebowiei TaxID=48269 RepID=A0A183MJU2_9TREM|nr:unnamed protein product [Schistosoma margrebowiei]